MSEDMKYVLFGNWTHMTVKTGIKAGFSLHSKHIAQTSIARHDGYIHT